jgi:hypothetical protein
LPGGRYERTKEELITVVRGVLGVDSLAANL